LGVCDGTKPIVWGLAGREEGKGLLGWLIIDLMEGADPDHTGPAPQLNGSKENARKSGM
jgi:hypothetical protein